MLFFEGAPGNTGLKVGMRPAAAGTAYSAELLAALRDVFAESFLPAARGLPEAARAWEGSTGGTMWRKRSGADSAFDIPAALSDDAAHPSAIARAMLSQWQPGPATDALQSVVAELLAVGRDHLPLPGAGDEVAATVPGSAYVMY